MDNYSLGCAIGLGIVQIVIGMWFLAWGGYFGLLGLPFAALPIWVMTILICTIFFSSGCLAITARKKAHVKSSFAVSIISSITAFSLLLTLLIAEGEAPFYFFGLPALIMFIVATISAINSGIRVSHHLHIESFPVSIYLIHYLKWKVFSRSEPAEVIARFCWFCNNHQRCVTSTPMPQLPPQTGSKPTGISANTEAKRRNLL